MFPQLSAEVTDRFTAVERFFKNCPKKPSEYTQTAKGLVFVQIYAAYEYTVRSVTRDAISTIASQRHNYADLKSSLLPIFLDPELTAVRETGPHKVWEARYKLFQRLDTAGPLPAVIAIPHDGSHFRSAQLRMIFKILGVQRPITHLKRHPQQIDRMVDHRNSIAHGEETAAEIGRNYTTQEILHQITLMKKICLRMILVVSQHCSDPPRYCR